MVFPLRWCWRWANSCFLTPYWYLVVVVLLVSSIPLQRNIYTWKIFIYISPRAWGLPSVENKAVSFLSFSSVLVDSIGTMDIPVMRREKRGKPVERGGPMSCWHRSTGLDSRHLCSLTSESSGWALGEPFWKDGKGAVVLAPVQALFSHLRNLSTLIEIQDNSFSISLFFPLNLEILLTPLFSGASTHALIFPSTLEKMQISAYLCF